MASPEKAILLKYRTIKISRLCLRTLVLFEISVRNLWQVMLLWSEFTPEFIPECLPAVVTLLGRGVVAGSTFSTA